MDYLVNLTKLSASPALDERMRAAGVDIRRVLAPELELVTDWVRRQFGPGWSGETAVSFARLPPTCFLATREGHILGFACHESIARGFFGPTGVAKEARGGGIGQALLFASLLDLKAMGYAYAVIGDVGPSEFYERLVGATRIPDSEPGIYRGLLKRAD